MWTGVKSWHVARRPQPHPTYGIYMWHNDSAGPSPAIVSPSIDQNGLMACDCWDR